MEKWRQAVHWLATVTSSGVACAARPRRTDALSEEKGRPQVWNRSLLIPGPSTFMPSGPALLQRNLHLPRLGCRPCLPFLFYSTPLLPCNSAQVSHRQTAPPPSLSPQKTPRQVLPCSLFSNDTNPRLRNRHGSGRQRQLGQPRHRRLGRAWHRSLV